VVFLTNNLRLPALTIAELYSKRWAVELFFKWIKQNLRIKAFYGNSINAVKTQVWVSVIVYLLVAIIRKELKIARSMGDLLQILSLTLLQKEPLSAEFFEDSNHEQSIEDRNQLNLFEL
jgi:IS4 transposase